MEKQFIYRYEMHCHDNWCSACATRSPQEMAAAYYRAGYAGMVFTNHFLLGNTAVDRSLPWEDKVRAYWDAHLAAREWAAGQERPFHVLFGLEHAYGHGKEVLTYGIDLDFLLAHPDLHLTTLEEYVRLVHEGGGLVVQAHPYRHKPYIDPDFPLQPELLDGAETYNYENTDEENAQAEALAEEYHLLRTSGADAHWDEGPFIGQAGIALPEPVDDGKALVALMKAGDYRLIIHGEID
mgnify:CR=1 FL=1